MTALAIINQPDHAAVALHPVRRRVLEQLREPGSAASVAGRLNLPRQKVNYHLRELEEAGLVALVEERRKGNCIERIVRATAATYIISPEVMGALGESPAEARDQFSSAYLIATAGRLIRDVDVLRRRAASVGKPLPTLTVEADVRFASSTARNAFAEELSQAVAQLISKYHDDKSPHGRAYRFVIAGHTAITKTEEDARAEARAAQQKEQADDESG